MTDLKKLLAEAQTDEPWSVVWYGDEHLPAIAIHRTAEDRICFMPTIQHPADGVQFEANAALIVAAVNAVPELLALREEVAELKREKGHWGFGVQPLHWLNEAEVHDSKSELIMQTAPIRLAIMQGGEVSDRDRALCRAVEDLDAAIKRFVERVHSEAARAALNQEPKP